MTDTITLPRAVVQGALEALEKYATDETPEGWHAIAAITAMREALEQSMCECTRSHPHENMDAMCELRTRIARLTNENARLKALQQPQKDAWRDAVDHKLVNLGSTTDSYPTPAAAINALIDWHVAVATDPAVNGGFKLVPEQPQREPEAIRHSFDGYGWKYVDSGFGSNWQEWAKRYADAQPLYTAPPRREWGQAAKICWEYHQAGGTAWDCWNALRMLDEAK